MYKRTQFLAISVRGRRPRLPVPLGLGNPTFMLGSFAVVIFYEQSNPNQCDSPTTYIFVEPKTKPICRMTEPEGDVYKPIFQSAWRLACRFSARSIRNANGPRPGTASLVGRVRPRTRHLPFFRRWRFLKRNRPTKENQGPRR